MRWLCLAALAAGCQQYERLDPKTVTSLDLMGTTSDGRPTRLVCARGALIDVFATTHDGKRHRAGSRDDIERDEFDPGLIALSASLGSFHDRAWNPPSDALALLRAARFTVTAKLVANSRLAGSIELVPTWTCDPPHVLVTGKDGAAGAAGADGAAQTGGDDGHDGARGGDAPATTILVGWTTGPGGQKLVLVDITTSDGHNDLRAVLAPNAKLHVNASGGAGGAGGTGGAGGATYDGGPQAGTGGNGGDGGDGGDGGAVTVRYDAASPELANVIVVDASGGTGGAGGGAGAGGAAPSDSPGLAGAGGSTGHDGHSGHDGPKPIVRADAGVAAVLATLEPRDDAHDVAPDSARRYQGDLAIAVAGAPPRTVHADLVSTRTHELHFTMAFGDACKLEFSRPRPDAAGGPQTYHYTLDKPVACATAELAGTIDHATLDLDPVHDTLAISATGTSVTPAAAITFSYLGKRK